MEDHRLGLGHLLALAGAALTLVALWRPWYSVDVRAALGPALGANASQSFPGLGELARSLASALPPTVSVDGWRALAGADVALCLGAVLVVMLVVGGAGAFGAAVRIDAAAAAKGIGALGVMGLGVCVWHAVKLPADRSIVHPAAGLWIALAASVVTTAGGVLAARPAPGPAPAAPEPLAVLDRPAAPVAPAATRGSVAPPSL